MADQLEEHCPEVHCEICQAYECLEELNIYENMEENPDDFCRFVYRPPDKSGYCLCLIRVG